MQLHESSPVTMNVLAIGSKRSPLTYRHRDRVRRRSLALMLSDHYSQNKRFVNIFCCCTCAYSLSNPLFRNLRNDDQARKAGPGGQPSASVVSGSRDLPEVRRCGVEKGGDATRGGRKASGIPYLDAQAAIAKSGQAGGRRRHTVDPSMSPRASAIATPCIEACEPV